MTGTNEIAILTAERDALRAELVAERELVRELTAQLRALEDIPDAAERRRARELLARIDAALTKGGGDNAV